MRDGRPNKPQAQRRVKALIAAKLIKKVRGGWEIVKQRKAKEE
jgi:hypothetical protein